MTKKNNDNRSEFRINDEIAVFIETESSPNNIEKERISISKTIDVSANGIQIINDSEIPLNSLLQLCIQVIDQHFYLSAEVMWVKTHEDQFFIGFKLLESDHTDITEWKEYICRQLDTHQH